MLKKYMNYQHDSSVCRIHAWAGGCAAGFASMDVYSAINAVAWENIGNTKMTFSIKKNKIQFCVVKFCS